MHKDKRIMNWQPFMNSVYNFGITGTRLSTVALLLFFAAGDPKTDHEVHLNLEELLELQHHREPVSFF